MWGFMTRTRIIVDKKHSKCQDKHWIYKINSPALGEFRLEVCKAKRTWEKDLQDARLTYGWETEELEPVTHGNVQTYQYPSKAPLES